jgi:hypothetical protein
MRSQRVWHGRVLRFEDLDRLLYETSWKVEADAHPPQQIALALIDSGGTADTWHDESRTMQVYEYVIPRQSVVRAIKGSARPGSGLYWPMRNPIGGASPGRKVAPSDLMGIMLDPHRANDILSEMIGRGVLEGPASEVWRLNRRDDPEYNAHMSNVHKVPERPGRSRVEVWRPIHAGVRIDYRACEAYQIVAAYVAQVHQLPPDEELDRWRAEEAETRRRAEERRAGGGRQPGENPWAVRPL